MKVNSILGTNLYVSMESGLEDRNNLTRMQLRHWMLAASQWSPA